MENDDERLLLIPRTKRGGWVCETVTFVLLAVWYWVTNREKYNVLLGNRKLDLYEIKMHQLQEVNFKEMERKYNHISQLEEMLNQSIHEFQSRMRHYSQLCKQEAKRRGKPETFTKEELEKRMTAAETKLQHRCISLRSARDVEKTSVHYIQNIQNDISECIRKIAQWRIQLSTKEHIKVMSDILQGVDGEKLTDLAESFVTGLGEFLDSLETAKRDLTPPDQENPPKNTSKASQIVEAEFWNDVFSSAKIVPSQGNSVMELA